MLLTLLTVAEQIFISHQPSYNMYRKLVNKGAELSKAQPSWDKELIEVRLNLAQPDLIAIRVKFFVF